MATHERSRTVPRCFIRPPQRSHARTSRPNVTRISSDHVSRSARVCVSVAGGSSIGAGRAWRTTFRTQFGVGRKDAGVQHQIDARFGDLRGEPLHQLNRLQQQVRGAIAKARLEAEQVAAVGAFLESIVGERWSCAIAHELLDTISLLCAEGHAAVQVESVQVRAQHAAARDTLHGRRQVLLERYAEPQKVKNTSSAHPASPLGSKNDRTQATRYHPQGVGKTLHKAIASPLRSKNDLTQSNDITCRE